LGVPYKDLTLRTVRSALSGGILVLGKFDRRLPWCRRLSDLVGAGLADIGGAENASNLEVAAVRRSAMLLVQLELMESRWATKQEGVASPRQIGVYQMVLNSWRRLAAELQAGNLARRRARDITDPLEYARTFERQDNAEDLEPERAEDFEERAEA
jgi:hypothetical protein